MKHLILIALIITSTTAFAGGKTCKAYVADKLTQEEMDMGITYYDYVDALASVGYEAISDKNGSEIHLSIGYGEWIRCYDSSATNFQVRLSEALSADGAVSIVFENTKTGDWEIFEKNIFKNPSRKKIMKRIKRLVKKLPKCN